MKNSLCFLLLRPHSSLLFTLYLSLAIFRVLSLAIMTKPGALLIGEITHVKSDWTSLSSEIDLQEFPDGDRKLFLDNCKKGEYDSVKAIYRSNASTSVSYHVRLLAKIRISNHLQSLRDHLTKSSCHIFLHRSNTSATMVPDTITLTCLPARPRASLYPVLHRPSITQQRILRHGL